MSLFKCQISYDVYVNVIDLTFQTDSFLLRRQFTNQIKLVSIYFITLFILTQQSVQTSLSAQP